MAYKTFNPQMAQKSYEMDLHNKMHIIAKAKTGRWFLLEEDGRVLASKRSETDILKVAAKIEERRLNGNLHGYRFGSKLSAVEVEARALAVWGARFSYENVHFDGHYWMGDIKDGDQVARNLRMDYHINYERLPVFATAA